MHSREAEHRYRQLFRSIHFLKAFELSKHMTYNGDKKYEYIKTHVRSIDGLKINQYLGEILEAVSFTDRIIFGRTNYNKTVSTYKENKHFYNKCAEEVIAFCGERDISYHIKAKTQTKE